MGINKDLGLPFGKGMEKIAFCFDIDGTLIDEDIVHHQMVALFLLLAQQKWKNVDFYIWSGGGKKYAETMHLRLGLPSSVKALGKLEHTELRKRYSKIIAIDDVQDTRLGDVNLIVRNK